VLLPSPTHTARRALAALAGVVALPLGIPGDVAGLATAASITAAPSDDAHEAATTSMTPLTTDGPLSARCLGATMCQSKGHMFSGKRDWTPEYCEKIATGVLASARKHDLNPALLLAVML